MAWIRNKNKLDIPTCDRCGRFLKSKAKIYPERWMNDEKVLIISEDSGVIYICARCKD